MYIMRNVVVFLTQKTMPEVAIPVLTISVSKRNCAGVMAAPVRPVLSPAYARLGERNQAFPNLYCDNNLQRYATI